MNSKAKADEGRSQANSGQCSPSVKKDAERLEFIEWLSLPRVGQEPEDSARIGEAIGGRCRYPIGLEAVPDLWEQVRKRVDERVKEDQADVMSALVDAAKAGNGQAQKLYLEYGISHGLPPSYFRS